MEDLKKVQENFIRRLHLFYRKKKHFYRERFLLYIP